MRAIALFVLQVIAFELTRCQSGGGGPSTFGYDASSACSKPYSRTKRAYYEDLPCDFRRQNWCTIAGSSYPWRAVRRFVRENQGLMRRMYGDQSYFNVFRAEFEKNDIELKYDEYHFAGDIRRFQYDNDYELIDDNRPKLSEYEGRAFTGRSFNDPITKRLKFPKLSEYTRSHFKPTEKTVSSSTASDTTIFSSTSLCSTLTSSSTATSDTATPSSTTSASVTAVTSTEEASTQPATASTFPKPLNITVEVADDDSTAINTTTAVNSTTTALPSVTVAQIVKEQNFSINEIPGQIDRIDENLEESVQATSENAKLVEIENITSVPTETTNVTKESLINREKEEEVEEEEDDVPKTAEQDEIVAESNQQEQFRPRPEYRPLPSAEESADTGGQLYQDAAAQEQPQVLKLRGVNACPVKEEVVAPFWANNTRGEVLALLNLYPFEQYVHWEKCTHENKQMHCRDGCRCEQQYRLHRLLAYDPSNECRGIFSDWFKFPSCCICRCYDLPIEFRVTSRSPRTSHQRRIKVQPPMRDRYV